MKTNSTKAVICVHQSRDDLIKQLNSDVIPALVELLQHTENQSIIVEFDLRQSSSDNMFGDFAKVRISSSRLTQFILSGWPTGVSGPTALQ